ncbi:flagellar brake protein [Paenibacillus pini]|uniref:Flagellar protein n=1 Tax=Paenibacillus pini JCM 16418 TaxID=1236976 RepID=W7YWJ5_9BACL|nr:flagellar brake domain-containing protein [Paenibacillus pini]GAF09031.1 hypothetical protein JCM16418_3148 [Paenibacillus pini JCM 16418]
MYPKISDQLFMSIDSGDEKAAGIEYKSRVADLVEDSMLIEIPLQEGTGTTKRLYVGDELSVYFISEGGTKNYFNTYVLGFKEDVIRMVRIRKPDADMITTVQRRSFFRVNAELELAVKTESMTRFVARTDDVGGGGLSFFCDANYAVKEGEALSCWILVPYKNGNLEHVPFKGEVVRVNKVENGRLHSMVKFTSISDMERQKLIRYCFERQMDFRNR